MANTVVASAEDILAVKTNQNFGLNSQVYAYNTNGTLNTITDSTTSVVYTFAYKTDGTLNTIADGSNTWTLVYTSDIITGITIS